MCCRSKVAMIVYLRLIMKTKECRNDVFLDLGISPQQNLQQRVEVSKSSIFSEHLPEGTVEFGDTWLSFKQRERLFNKENGDSGTGSLWNAAVIPYTIDCSLSK